MVHGRLFTGPAEIAAYKIQIAQQIQADKQKAIDDAKKAADDAAKAAAQRGVLTVDSNPTGANVTIGDFQKKTPAQFSDLVPGTFSILIQQDGYEDFKEDVTITADKPTDLGTIALEQKNGSLFLTSPQANVTYKMTGPDGSSHDGQIPDKLEKLPVGTYNLTPTLGDWTLAAVTITVRDHAITQKDIKFPYANVMINTVPPGATIREGRTVLGQTPLNLSPFRPRDMQLSADLPPYTVQHFDVHVPDFGNVNKQITLQKDKDFVAASGLPMVWIPDGGYWVGKYEVRQSDFETVTGYNPSTFRQPGRPVETVSWESAQAYIAKLNDFEKKAGKIPAGFHYSLPKETQWDQYNADAKLDLAATSRVTTLTSTQNVGYSEPNKYGLYDTLGNVWEWCLDDFDDKGNHTLRGGTWLSSPEDFSGPDARQGAPPKYADKFIGFRVVLTPN